MKNVLLFGTAREISGTDKFEGVVTFKSEGEKEISVKYNSISTPLVKDNFVDIFFIENDKEFHITGIFSLEIFSHLTQHEQCIAVLSLSIIPGVISKAVLSAQMDNFRLETILGLFDKYVKEIEVSAALGSIERVNDKVYEEIFNS